jgi:hypothetical protein
LFCLENDWVAAPLLDFLAEQESFTGSAAQLHDKLLEHEPDPQGKLSAKRLGRRLRILWPHLESTVDVAKQQKDRKGFLIYTLGRDLNPKNAEFAEFKSRFQQKSLYAHT